MSSDEFGSGSDFLHGFYQLSTHEVVHAEDVEDLYRDEGLGVLLDHAQSRAEFEHLHRYERARSEVVLLPDHAAE